MDLVFHRSRAETIYAKEKGARKLQYRQFLHALMLIAEKRQTGFQDVVNRIRRNGQQHREASMADFLVSHDPRGDAQDCQELRRPTGLPMLLQQGLTSRAAGTKSERAGALPPGAGGLVTMHPSAAKGIGAAEGAGHISSLHACYTAHLKSIDGNIALDNNIVPACFDSCMC